MTVGRDLGSGVMKTCTGGPGLIPSVSKNSNIQIFLSRQKVVGQKMEPDTRNCMIKSLQAVKILILAEPSMGEHSTSEKYGKKSPQLRSFATTASYKGESTCLFLVLEDDVEVPLGRGAGVAIGPLDLDVAERLEGRHEDLLRDVPGHATEEDLARERSVALHPRWQLPGPGAGGVVQS